MCSADLSRAHRKKTIPTKPTRLSTMNKFTFTEEQLDEAHVIIEAIVEKCRKLQSETKCPDAEIVKLLKSITSIWETKE